MKHSLAAVFSGELCQIELWEIPMPELRAGECLVRVLGCTLCASDLHSFAKRRSVPVPTILGHEIAGEIVAIGKGPPLQDLKGHPVSIGDRVTWAVVAHCGQCRMCQTGLTQKCERGVKYGHSPFRPERELLGGLAEYCLLVAGTSLVRLPPELPLEVACPASCATATAAATLELAEDLSGRQVCVIGLGLLGLTACAMSHARGAAVVAAVDPNPARRELARQFGATHVSSPGDELELAGSWGTLGGFDVALEMSGTNAGFDLALATARVGGTILLVGAVFPGPPVEVILEQIVRRQLTIRGQHNYAPRHLLSAVEFLEQNHGRFPFAELVSQWYPLDQAADALAAAEGSGAIRVGIRAKS